MKSPKKLMKISPILIVLLTLSQSLFGAGSHYPVFGLSETSPGQYFQYPNEMYKIDIGLIWDIGGASDQIDYYTTATPDANYCGDSHKADGNKFDHWDTNGVSWPT